MLFPLARKQTLRDRFHEHLSISRLLLFKGVSRSCRYFLRNKYATLELLECAGVKPQSESSSWASRAVMSERRLKASDKRNFIKSRKSAIYYII
jgi:hypothetical protein